MLSLLGSVFLSPSKTCKKLEVFQPLVSYTSLLPDGIYNIIFLSEKAAVGNAKILLPSILLTISANLLQPYKAYFPIDLILSGIVTRVSSELLINAHLAIAVTSLPEIA